LLAVRMLESASPQERDPAAHDEPSDGMQPADGIEADERTPLR
jgi:hypothetical protein